MQIADQTAPYVSAFERNIRLERIDAALANLVYINQILDTTEQDDA